MIRREFDKPTKRLALARSNGLCEAVGRSYNLSDGQRCNFPFGLAVEFDHIDAIANDDNSLSNCAAICIPCHGYKTAKVDIPKHAKIKRIRDKHTGIARPKHKWASRPFNQAKFDNVKYTDRSET
jgi:5-methylcytosine-specific restriction endonuclease McrA